MHVSCLWLGERLNPSFVKLAFIESKLGKQPITHQISNLISVLAQKALIQTHSLSESKGSPLFYI